MNIRCKTRCASVQQNKDGENKVYQEVIGLVAVYSDDPKSENKQWARWTPNFSLSMAIDNPNCFGAFQPAQEYFVDFTPATSDGLRLDGPTFEQYLEGGYAPENYPPQGYSAKPSPAWEKFKAEQAAKQNEPQSQS